MVGFFIHPKSQRIMIPEKTIRICDRDVTLRYCAATETGFEQLAQKPITVFRPIQVKDNEGNVTDVKPGPATSQDYIMLATAAIIAAAEFREQDAPVSVKDILYNTTPAEIQELTASVIELSAKWYQVSPVVKPETDETEDDGGDQKNC
jgi:hypothetical protein